MCEFVCVVSRIVHYSLGLVVVLVSVSLCVRVCRVWYCLCICACVHWPASLPTSAAARCGLHVSVEKHDAALNLSAQDPSKPTEPYWLSEFWAPVNPSLSSADAKRAPTSSLADCDDEVVEVSELSPANRES